MPAVEGGELGIITELATRSFACALAAKRGPEGSRRDSASPQLLLAVLSMPTPVHPQHTPNLYTMTPVLSGARCATGRRPLAPAPAARAAWRGATARVFCRLYGCIAGAWSSALRWLFTVISTHIPKCALWRPFLGALWALKNTGIAPAKGPVSPGQTHIQSAFSSIRGALGTTETVGGGRSCHLHANCVLETRCQSPPLAQLRGASGS